MDRAVALYMRAGDLGDLKARSAVAVLANNGKLTSSPDTKLGASLLGEVARRNGDADDLLKLAQMTEKGVGRPADPAEAAKNFTSEPRTSAARSPRPSSAPSTRREQ